MIYRGPGFLASVSYDSSPTHSLPPPVSNFDQRHTVRLRKRDNLLAAGWGRPQESLVLYKSSILSAIIPLAVCNPPGLQPPFLFQPSASQAAFDPASHFASETVLEFQNNLWMIGTVVIANRVAVLASKATQTCGIDSLESILAPKECN